MVKKKRDDDLMKVLMMMSYKGYPVYVRMVQKEMFIWDVIVDNQLYSSYIIIKPKKGEKSLSQREIEEVIKMCYAGAGATVDNILGVELSKTDKEAVEVLEKYQKQVEA